jgi:hypothetical protein
MSQICAGHTDSELEQVTGFLRRTAGAGRAAAEELTEDEDVRDVSAMHRCRYHALGMRYHMAVVLSDFEVRTIWLA